MFDIVYEELIVLINMSPALIIFVLAMNWTCELLFGGK